LIFLGGRAGTVDYADVTEDENWNINADEFSDVRRVLSLGYGESGDQQRNG
jgi:hypothetical protein